MKLPIKLTLLIFSILLTGCSSSIIPQRSDTNNILIQNLKNWDVDVYEYSNSKLSFKNQFLIPINWFSFSLESEELQSYNYPYFIRLNKIRDNSRENDPKIESYDFYKVNIENWSQESLLSIKPNLLRRSIAKDNILMLINEWYSTNLYKYSIKDKKYEKIGEVSQDIYINSSEIMHIKNSIYWFIVENENEDSIFLVQYDINKNTLNNKLLFTYNELLENWGKNVNYIDSRNFCIFDWYVIYSTLSSNRSFKLNKYNYINNHEENILKSEWDWIRRQKCLWDRMIFEKYNKDDRQKHEIYQYYKDKIKKITNWILENANKNFLIYSDANDNLYLISYKDSNILKIDKTYDLFKIFLNK